MNLCVLIATLGEVLGGGEYGQYKPYRQVGGVIYDYTGNGFHGRNGKSLGSDLNDGVFTDRGIYLDGVKSYFLTHSDEFGQGPQFPSLWSVSMWIHPFSYGPLMHRVSNLGNTSFKLSFSSNQIDIELVSGCNPSCTTYLYGFSIGFPLNTWFLISMELHDSSKIRFYENDTLLGNYNLGKVYRDRDSYSFTYIGTDSSSFLEGFIYYIEFSSGNPAISNLVATSNSGCNGACYYSNNSGPICNCSNCVLAEFSQCLSQCTDPFLASDCSHSTSDCNGIYTFTHGCTECPTNEWPVCDTDPSIDLSSNVCHSDCTGCTGPTANDCMLCPNLYMNKISGNCQCPSNSSPVGLECLCASSYFMIKSGSVYSCESCSQPCSECSGSSSFCTACVQTGANLDFFLGLCSCPSNSTSGTSSCDCDQGYFLELVGSNYQCSSCSFSCSVCSGSSTNCSACATTYNLSGSSCVCPNGSTIVSDQCQCNSGFFLDFDTQYSCVSCEDPCEECSGTSMECTTCLATFNLSGASCVCPSDSTLVSSECRCNPGFYLSLSSEYECIACTSPCSECSGSSTACTACVASYNLSVSSCVCPNDSSVVADQCQCNSGFCLMLSSEYECIACTSPCSECSGSPTTCTACVTSYNLSASSCVCPSDSTVVSNQCQCDSGFYSMLSSEYECIACTSPCSECSGSSTNCTACIASYNLSASFCVCPSDSTIVSNQCQCDSGFYLQLNTEYECLSCVSPCQECSGAPETCTACAVTFNLEASSCQCPQSSSLVLGACQCEEGKIMILNSVYSCEDCLFPCLTCSGSLETCTSCEEPFYLTGSTCQCPEGSSLSSNQCVCEPGFFLSLMPDSVYECSECSYPCSECSSISSNCTECVYASSNIENGSCVCPANSSLDSETCVCEEGYFMASINGVYECLECDSSCKECSGSATFCVSCSVSNAVLEEGACSCPENSQESEGVCVCKDGFYLKDSKCERTQGVELNSFDSAESIFISSVIVMLSVSTILASDPSSVWIILNNIQILSFLPLHGSILPQKLETTCNAFKLSSLLPNLSLYLFEDELNTEGLPKIWAEKGMERTHFLLNIGQILLVLFVYFCCFLVTLFLACIKKDKFLRYLKEYRYNIVLRLWVEIFIELLVASVISLDQLLLGHYGYENLIGGSVFVVQIGSILLIWIKLYKLKNNSENTPEIVKDRFSSLFYEFDLDRSMDSYYYYIYFMVRRTTYILGLYYFHSTPLLQLFASSNGSVLHILILIVFMKFKDKLNQIVMIAIEALFCVIYAFILYNNSGISDREEVVVDYLSVSIVGLMGSILLMNHLVRVYSSLSERCKTKQRAVIDVSAVIGVSAEEESKIFALPQNRKKNNPHMSLNIENIY